MKTLLILRHGKAEDHSPKGDKERALTGRGERDAAAVGEQIGRTFGCPDLIVSSDAKRARQTAKIVAKATGYAAEIETRGAIYGADLNTLLSVIHELPEAAGCVLLVGHNPGLEMLAGVLDAEALAPPPLPTAGLAPLQFAPTLWANTRPRTGRRVPMTSNPNQSKGT